MLRSLFSGVTGLQSHQIAMDVESNNIANVNTIGYKYSRANFSDLLAQTSQIATAPQGSLGGKNAVQVGLGTSINSITKIMTQGSIQNTDKNTDVAIQGDGFYIVSADGGNTYKYSRSGDFKFDAKGNFVDNNGFITQGWVRNDDTGLVDSTAPIGNIQIQPGLTTPANASTAVVVKANLSTSTINTQIAPTYAINSSGVYVDSDGIALPAADQPNADDMSVMFNSSGEALQLKDGQRFTIAVEQGGVVVNTYEFIYDASNSIADTSPAYYFHSVNDLRGDIATALSNNAGGGSVDVSVNASGKLVVNTDNVTTGSGFRLTIGNGTGNQENLKLSEAFSTLGGSYTAGNAVAGAGDTRQSLGLNAATHAASIDVFDSLGSKHTVTLNFRKIQSLPTSAWEYTITVPNPATITGATTTNPNVLTGGVINFDENGALADYTIPSFDMTANNGSSSPQTVNLDFGTPAGGFDGITSFDNPSATSGISQDGYPGGDLVGIRIDQSGTLIGSFSNGRSFGLAQIAMAKFTNNEGLVSDGGNVYLQSANSGDPIIGTAATAGRGFMQSSALEASNVDLSKSLTNLIIIQRGYQANAKTITTSDTLLETLLGIKR